MFSTTTLYNGLRIITHEHKDALTCYLEVNVLAGSYFSPPGKEGLAHFLEHMVMNGTERYPSSKELHKAFERIGASLNARTSTDTVSYYVKVRGDSWGSAAKLLFDLVFNPLLSEKELNVEKKTILEELARVQDIISWKINDALSSIIFRGGPLAHPGIGYKKTINSFTLDDIKELFSSRYQPQNTVIYSSGNLSHDKVAEFAENIFSGTNKRESDVVLDLKEFPKYFGPKVSIVRDPTKQARLWLAFPSAVTTKEDLVTAKTLVNVLRGRGRLRERLREKEQLAYDVSVASISYGNLRSTIVHGGFNYKKADLALKLICEELTNIKKEPIGEEEFKLAKTKMETGILFDLESPKGRALFAVDSDRVLGSPMNVEEVKKLINQVTTKDIQNLARKLFTPDKAFLAVSHKPESKEPFRKILAEGLS